MTLALLAFIVTLIALEYLTRVLAGPSKTDALLLDSFLHQPVSPPKPIGRQRYYRP